MNIQEVEYITTDHIPQTLFSCSSSPSSWSSLNSFHAVVSALNLFSNSAKEAIFLNSCSQPPNLRHKFPGTQIKRYEAFDYDETMTRNVAQNFEPSKKEVTTIARNVKNGAHENHPMGHQKRIGQ
uniref:Uncharacterized protein n=1 Tax=Romanomermis culicivorax TaxID=13658 RepID=A0A915JUP0_ROMCU